MDALDSLTGIEFEALCKELLASMGFIVETTSTTGDGGIDLIARYNAPILSGKYIIQCKRYAGSVGVPIVRDLYGVVTAERANKGVLITTGRVTNAAVEFAIDKNLELIDGAKLRSLISKTDIHFDGEGHPSSFVDYPKFDAERYRYYVESIAEDPHDLRIMREFVPGFLMPYLLQGKGDAESLDLIHAGLAEEYIKRVDQFLVMEFGKKKPGFQWSGRLYEERLKGFAWLYTFDLSEYVKPRSRYLKHKHAYSEWANRGEGDLSRDEWIHLICQANLLKLADLHSLFSYFGIEDCCSRVVRAMGFTDEHTVADANQMLLEIYDNKVLSSHPDENNWQVDAIRPVAEFESGSLNLTPYFNRFASTHRDKIEKEIEKVEKIIKFLPWSN